MFGARDASPGKESIGTLNKVEHLYSTAEHEVNIIRVHNRWYCLQTRLRSSTAWSGARHIMDIFGTGCESNLERALTGGLGVGGDGHES